MAKVSACPSTCCIYQYSTIPPLIEYRNFWNLCRRRFHCPLISLQFPAIMITFYPDAEPIPGISNDDANNLHLSFIGEDARTNNGDTDEAPSKLFSAMGDVNNRFFSLPCLDSLDQLKVPPCRDWNVFIPSNNNSVVTPEDSDENSDSIELPNLISMASMSSCIDNSKDVVVAKNRNKLTDYEEMKKIVESKSTKSSSMPMIAPENKSVVLHDIANANNTKIKTSLAATKKLTSLRLVTKKTMVDCVINNKQSPTNKSRNSKRTLRAVVKQRNNRAGSFQTNKKPYRFRIKKEEYCCPLNCAIQLRSSAKVLKELIRAKPAVLLIKDGRQQETSLSILLKCYSSCSSSLRKEKDTFTSVVSCMLDNIRGCACIQDRHLNTPLHVACSHGASLGIVQQVYLAYPQALHKANFHGDTPLQLALRSTAANTTNSNEVVDFLLDEIINKEI